MKPTSLLELARNRQAPDVLLADLKSENMADSLRAGQNLIQNAKAAQLSMQDYLRLAVDPQASDFAKGSDLNGFEASLAFLGLPVRDDLDNGVLLQLAAETFQSSPGTRALFPQVIDTLLQWKYRQDQFENVGQIVSQSRTMNGVELLTTVVNDKEEDYQQFGVIAEGARVPIRSLRTSEKTVKFYKFGGGIEFTYEFERRASLDIVTPYASRMRREVEIGKVAIATAVLLNGDGLAGPAPVTTATSLAAGMPEAPTVVAGRIQWELFLAWLVARARAGAPIDTVLGNWDMWLEWRRLFATPTQAAGVPVGEIMQRAGVSVSQAPGAVLDLNVQFAVSSQAPAAKLVGFVKNETLEELVENGSEIEESVRSIENQKVRYVSTENKGYRLVFDDTRSVLELA